jgi:hypothetical protein
MTALTLKHVLDAGTVPATQNSSASDTVDLGNGHNTFLVYTNTGGSPCSVVITPTVALDNGTLYPAKTWTVAATTGVQWIPIRKSYDDGSGNNTATVTCVSGSGATLQVVAVRVDF